MLFTCALFYYAVDAQKISVTADRTKILLGEQIVLQLKAEDINDKNDFLQNWFLFNDSSAHIQIVKKEPVDTIEINGLNTYLQKIIITSFDSGRWQITPPPIIIQNRATGSKTVLKADSLFIEVLPVDVSGLMDYHVLKDIIDVEAKPDYLLYILIGTSVIVLAVFIWLYVEPLSKKKTQPVKAVYKGTALEHALKKIKELQQQNPPAKGQMKLFYTELSEICREYFSEQLNIQASHITSDELMVAIIVYLQDEKRRTAFFQLLRLIDAVKFAKYLPAEVHHDEAVTTATASLQHIDQLIKQSKQHDN
ncbi:BatD family protein [soil metagenome]